MRTESAGTPEHLAIDRLRWLATLFVLVAFTLAGVPTARAGSAEPDLFVDEVDQMLGPLALKRPLAATTMTRLIDEADGLYRSGRITEAIAGYRTVVRIDPIHPIAWLRLGNLHHRRGEALAAMDAYRRAAAVATDEPDGGDLELRAGSKSLVNLAILHAQELDAVLARLERMGEPPLEAAALARLRDTQRDGRRRIESLPAPAARGAAPATAALPGAVAGTDAKANVHPIAGNAVPPVQYLSGAPARPTAPTKR